MRQLVRLVAAGALAALAGCSGAGRPPELDMETQWADAMRRLGMFSFFPATEDVQPGDLYLLVPKPSGFVAWWGNSVEPHIVPWSRLDHEGDRFSKLRLATLAPMTGSAAPARRAGMTILDHLTAQQAERLRIEPLAPVEAADGKASARPAEVRDASLGGGAVGNADNGAAGVRLRRSAIPMLTVGRFSEQQLSAAGILGNLGANLGLSRGTETALTIALHDIQELALDASRTNEMIEQDMHAVMGVRIGPDELLHWLYDLRAGRNSRYDLTGAACNGRVSELQDQRVEIAVVNRVIYAGRIEYSFSERASGALKAAIDAQNALDLAIRKPPMVPDLAKDGAAKDGAPKPDPAKPAAVDNSPAANRAALDARLTALTGLPGGAEARAGVSTSIGYGSFGTLSLSQSFNRPIAVGAGSRVRFSFHAALAGVEERGYQVVPGAYPPTLTRRFLEAAEYCRVAMATRGAAFSEAALWRAMAPGRGDLAPPRSTAVPVSVPSARRLLVR